MLNAILKDALVAGIVSLLVAAYLAGLIAVVVRIANPRRQTRHRRR